MRSVNTIMRERQAAVRREMDRRGIALKAVQFDSGICASTLISYFPGGEREPANIPMSALFQLIEGNALPLDLIGLLLPDGVALVALPEGIDHDAASEAMRDYLAQKDAAHHPASPGGREIAPEEDRSLTMKLAAVRA